MKELSQVNERDNCESRKSVSKLNKNNKIEPR